jgi:membrane associated rhomboid family serine protease
VPWLPDGLFPKLQLLGILVGLAFVLRKGVPKAYGLGVIMVGVFALDFVSRLAGQGGTQEELGYQADRFLRGETWWTPLTSIFTHAPPSGRSLLQIHIFGNLLILIAAGPALEDRIGERKFTLVFFLGGFVALVAHTILAYATSIVAVNSLAIGASGAIFAVLSAFALRHPREPLPMLLLFFMVMMPAFAVLLVFLGFNLVYALSDSLGAGTGIAWWGHFAGFLVGMAFAYTLPRTDPRFAMGRRALPDAEKLAPLATTPETKRILERIRQFGGEARTKDDAALADAWVDRFFQKATCPEGHKLTRRGMGAACSGGETTVDFSRAPAK